MSVDLNSVIYQCKLKRLTDLKSNYVKGLYQCEWLSSGLEAYQSLKDRRWQKALKQPRHKSIRQAGTCLIHCSADHEEAENNCPSSLLSSWIFGPDYTTFLRMSKTKMKAMLPQTNPLAEKQASSIKARHTVRPAERLSSPITLWMQVLKPTGHINSRDICKHSLRRHQEFRAPFPEGAGETDCLG